MPVPEAAVPFGLNVVADGQISLVVGDDMDSQRFAVADFIVLHGILYQHLYRHRRETVVFERLGYLYIKLQVVLKTHLQQEDISRGELHLFRRLTLCDSLLCSVYLSTRESS